MSEHDLTGMDATAQAELVRSGEASPSDPLFAIERARRTAIFNAFFNATGHPAISIPLGMTDDGLPMGVQLVAPQGREDLLIRVAAQLEEAQPWADRRPKLWAGAEQLV